MRYICSASEITIYIVRKWLMKVSKEFFIFLGEKSLEFFIGIEYLCECKQLIIDAIYSAFRPVLFIQYVIRGVKQRRDFTIGRLSISDGRFFNKQEVFREWRYIGWFKHCWHGLHLFFQLILHIEKIYRIIHTNQQQKWPHSAIYRRCANFRAVSPNQRNCWQ